MITISLNNQSQQLEDGTLLSDAINTWGYQGKIAVATNGEFVPRSTYTSRPLCDGDQLDIVQPVGGG